MLRSFLLSHTVCCKIMYGFNNNNKKHFRCTMETVSLYEKILKIKNLERLLYIDNLNYHYFTQENFNQNSFFFFLFSFLYKPRQNVLQIENYNSRCDLAFETPTQVSYLNK